MKRLLAIVLVGVLLCAVGAWLVERPSVQSPLGEPAPAPEAVHSDSPLDSPPLEARVPDTHQRSGRTDLTELEPFVLYFKGPGATLNLRVVDSLKKDPVGDVAVRVSEGLLGSRPGAAEHALVDWRELQGKGGPALTDGSGRSSLRVPAAHPLRLELEGKGLRTEPRMQEVPALAPNEQRLVEIEVALEDNLKFCGKVCDKITNAPLAGVQIQLERRPSIEPIARSDARGRFELRTNSWESRKASASRRGYVPLDFEIGDQQDSPARALQLALTPASTVTGYYFDCDDRPVAEGSLRFWTSSGFRAHVYPHEDGRFEADSLPTGEAIKVDLELEHRPIVREVASIVLAPGEVRRIDWKLPPRFTLHGIVLDELGAPVKGCELALYYGNATDPHCLESRSGLDERDSSTSDEEGRFTFSKAGPGIWVVALLHVAGGNGFLRDPNSWKIPLAAQNLALTGPETEEVVLRCCTHTTIQGRVVDPDGRPVPRAMLHVKLVGCDASVQRWSGQDGSFSVPVPGPDSFELSVEADERFLESDKLTVRGGEHDIALRLRRAPTLRLRVVDGQTREPLRAQAFGLGAAGSTLSILGYDGDNDPTRLVVPCPADTYRLFVRSFDGRCGTLDGVLVDAESSAREWTVSVAPGKNALVHSDTAGGAVEVQFSWNGIPIDREELAADSKVLLSVPSGTLSAKYRRMEPPGEWRTLDTLIDESRLVDIDLPFP